MWRQLDSPRWIDEIEATEAAVERAANPLGWLKRGTSRPLGAATALQRTRFSVPLQSLSKSRWGFRISAAVTVSQKLWSSLSCTDTMQREMSAYLA